MITAVVDAKTGALVSCEEAYKHRDREYVCPVCGCPVQIKRSSKGNYYAARMPGCRHDEMCPTDDAEHDGRCILIDATDLSLIDQHIMMPTSTRTGPHGPGGPGGPHGTEQQSAIMSLRDIDRMGLCGQQDTRLGPKSMLSDIMVNRYTVASMDLVHQDLGARAVVAVPMRFFADDLVIRYRLADDAGNDRGKKYNLPVFDLAYDDKDAFWRDWAKLFAKVDGRYVSRYRYVLIYAHWVAATAGDYRDIALQYAGIDGTYHGYQRGQCIYPSKQVYKPVKAKL